MDVKDILLLASQSVSRQTLLKHAGIPFESIPHDGQEKTVQFKGSFVDFVVSLAQEKMKNVQLPRVVQADRKNHFIVTADTLIRIKSSGVILGKPDDVEHARKMLRLMQHEVVEVLTGCCLQKRDCDNNAKILSEVAWATGAEVEFFVEDDFIDEYFKRMPIALCACGAGIVEGYGQCFLKSIQGSYSTVIGLPLYELREELKKMQFRF